MRTPALFSALMILSGCALLDGLNGQLKQESQKQDAQPCEEPGQCQTLNCESPHQLFGVTDNTEKTVPVCGQPSFTHIGCGEDAGGANAALSVHFQEPGDYVVCLERTELGGSLLVDTALCNSPFEDSRMPGDSGSPAPRELCLLPSDCVEISTDGGPVQLIWQGDAAEIATDTCGDLRLSFRLLDPNREGPENCLDGKDNDGDGLTDCESFSCRTANKCQPEEPLGTGCNPKGSYAAPLTGVPACLCEDDKGCDTVGEGYVCHKNFFGDDGPGVCAPTCKDVDWCGDYARECSGGRDALCELS